MSFLLCLIPNSELCFYNEMLGKSHFGSSHVRLWPLCPLHFDPRCPRCPLSLCPTDQPAYSSSACSHRTSLAVVYTHSALFYTTYFTYTLTRPSALHSLPLSLLLPSLPHSACQLLRGQQLTNRAAGPIFSLPSVGRSLRSRFAQTCDRVALMW